MAHPDRLAMANQLVEDLDLGGEHVAWDLGDGEWDTAWRAWAAHDCDAEWLVVLQDDAVPCPSLVAGLELALNHVPAECAVSLYVGTLRPEPHLVRRAVAAADDVEAAWIVMSDLHWGVGVALPAAAVGPAMAWCDSWTGEYDRRLSTWLRDVAGWPVWYTWPSLVDHADGPSLIPSHRGGRGPRRAHRPAGHMPATDIDWAGPVFDARPLEPHRRLAAIPRIR
jgi:hypothetical protein